MSVPERTCLPADGVYAGTFTGADGVERLAALSLGRRPTFYASSRWAGTWPWSGHLVT